MSWYNLSKLMKLIALYWTRLKKRLFTDFTWRVHGISSLEIPFTANFMVSWIGSIAPSRSLANRFGPIRDTIKSTVVVIGIKINEPVFLSRKRFRGKSVSSPSKQEKKNIFIVLLQIAVLIFVYKQEKLMYLCNSDC